MRRLVSLLVVVIALVGAAGGAARGDARISVGNDVFSELDPPFDDSGFTNDLAFAFWRPYRGYLVGFSVLDRWITEVGGSRRWDQLDVLAIASRTWHDHVELGARLGPTFGGNLGGRWMQNSWHTLTGNWTLDDGLQHEYPGGRSVGLVVGGTARAWVGGPVRAYAALDAQAGLGAGVSWFEAVAGGEASGCVRGVRIGAHAEAAAGRYHVVGANYALPGGYGIDRWEPGWRAGVHVAWRRYRVDYQYRANEGGSGEPIGVVGLTIRPPGQTFGCDGAT